jgi:hypothetical protein
LIENSICHTNLTLFLQIGTMESSDTRSKVRLTNHLPSSPWIEIADKRIICVEHPAIIRNLQNAIPTLGGDEALSKVRSGEGMAIGLVLKCRDTVCY